MIDLSGCGEATGLASDEDEKREAKYFAPSSKENIYSLVRVSCNTCICVLAALALRVRRKVVEAHTYAKRDRADVSKAG